jgi:hypothetical protein
MRFLGQLENLSPRVERVLAAFPDGLPKGGRKPTRALPNAKRRGSGAIERAVIRVLADGQAWKLGDIVQAVERLVHGRVSVESVGWCLRAGSRKERPLFDRPARGYYQLRPQT